MRRLVTEAAWQSIRRSARVRAYFRRVAGDDPGRRKIAVVAVMRRLGIVMWHVGLAAQQRAGVFPARQPHTVTEAAG